MSETTPKALDHAQLCTPTWVLSIYSEELNYLHSFNLCSSQMMTNYHVRFGLNVQIT
jgi:hypothetical protein